MKPTTTTISTENPPPQTLHPQQLESDLSYRLKYLTRFIGFSREDTTLIHQSTPIIAPLIPTVTELVYDKLFSFSITKQVFAEYALKKPFTLLEGKGLDHKKGEQLKFRKDMLGKYLIKLITCDYENVNFLKYLDYIGKLHTSKAGKPNIVVDYIHCNTLFGFVSEIISNAILEAPNLTFSTKFKTIRAFNKLFWIQNDLFSRHYQQEEQKNPSCSIQQHQLDLSMSEGNLESHVHSSSSSSFSPSIATSCALGLSGSVSTSTAALLDHQDGMQKNESCRRVMVDLHATVQSGNGSPSL
ncbi:hypothetical protein FDP41_001517 [Naegleria fowleri]|uniref:Globin-sensor domain-containing protein n=1 Tax=Naegleria fowleri TaxID=5763 RepID=A0A6A5BXY5_NAEFO|nr:uncharacterized protein FDP41_001517 [Naegleria fowleri]KAF0979174.1 hypothetical protein FDP41_001517 [Naegleria fowleri]CAG4714281.1 unnamed protein product [Naegleria fowleri]